MTNPPFRSPSEKLRGLYHFPRMLDKIRLHLGGQLPEEYQPNFGLHAGLDGSLCGFLGIEFAALCEQAKSGGSDEEIAEWSFETGLRPNRIQKHIWNEFARKVGWNDYASDFMQKVIDEDGADIPDYVKTTFDLIDFREGRSAKTKR